MSQLLVAVKSSYDQMESGSRHAAIRAMIGTSLVGKGYLKFFIGREILALDKSVTNTARNSYVPKADEVVLDANDEPARDVYKTRAICQYALGKNISHVLMVNANSIIRPRAIFAETYMHADYAGVFEGEPDQPSLRLIPGTGQLAELFGWARGNLGYFLSVDALTEVADTAPKSMMYGVGQNDDVWVGQVLGPLIARGQLLAQSLTTPVCWAPIVF